MLMGDSPNASEPALEYSTTNQSYSIGSHTAAAHGSYGNLNSNSIDFSAEVLATSGALCRLSRLLLNRSNAKRNTASAELVYLAITIRPSRTVSAKNPFLKADIHSLARINQYSNRLSDKSNSPIDEGSAYSSNTEVPLQQSKPFGFTTPFQRKRKSLKCTWTDAMDRKLQELVSKHCYSNWPRIAGELNSSFPASRHNGVQCLHRWSKVLDPVIKKGGWSKTEDRILKLLVSRVGENHWALISRRLENRLGKQCRERWRNHVDPSINRGPWTPEEEKKLWELYSLYPNGWVSIAKSMAGRTENAVKNHFHSMKRRSRTRLFGFTRKEPLSVDSNAKSACSYDAQKVTDVLCNAKDTDKHHSTPTSESYTCMKVMSSSTPLIDRSDPTGDVGEKRSTALCENSVPVHPLHSEAEGDEPSAKRLKLDEAQVDQISNLIGETSKNMHKHYKMEHTAEKECNSLSDADRANWGDVGVRMDVLETDNQTSSYDKTPPSHPQHNVLLELDPKDMTMNGHHVSKVRSPSACQASSCRTQSSSRFLQVSSNLNVEPENTRELRIEPVHSAVNLDMTLEQYESASPEVEEIYEVKSATIVRETDLKIHGNEYQSRNDDEIFNALSVLETNETVSQQIATPYNAAHQVSPIVSSTQSTEASIEQVHIENFEVFENEFALAGTSLNTPLSTEQARVSDWWIPNMSSPSFELNSLQIEHSSIPFETPPNPGYSGQSPKSAILDLANEATLHYSDPELSSLNISTGESISLLSPELVTGSEIYKTNAAENALPLSEFHTGQSPSYYLP